MAASKFDIKDKKNIYVVFVVIICLSSVYLFYDSKWTEFQVEQKALIDEQKNAKAELDKINSQRSRIPDLEKEVQKAQMEFDKLKEMFPEEEKVPDRLKDLYSAVKVSGVNIQEFKPNESKIDSHFVQHRYSFNVNAGYHMLGYLFADIARLKYPTTIDNLKLNRFGAISQEVKKQEEHGWEPITMSVSFDLTTFTSRKK